MLCPKCGYYSEQEESVCPECGRILSPLAGEALDGVQAIRQGKRAREEAGKRIRHSERDLSARPGASRAGMMPAVRDTRREDTPDNEENGYTPAEDETAGEAGEGFERRRQKRYDDSVDESTAERYAAMYATGTKVSHLVNWVKVAIAAVLAVILLVAGVWFFLNRTGAGQRLLARMGRDASSVAYWAVGDEKMNSGDIDGAIECFEKARAKDEAEGVVDVDGLLTLGSALEAAERTQEAAALYEEIYLTTPSRTEAYVNHIRILQNSQIEGDLAKAGDLMKLAYEKTGDKTFLSQRSDLLPAPPEVKPIAGYYERKITLELSSYQGYDVYYTFDENAELPYGGIKATRSGGIMLEEGIYNLRAVAVFGELVSDELHGTYKVIMPSPMTPRATLAPNTYRTSQQVRLKPGVDDEQDTSIVIYYTVDGSAPDSDSPIYDGEPIRLPNGWVTLKAVAVNRYRKLSNVLEIKYKIEANPKPKTAFSADDTIDSLKIFKTTQPEFNAAYGEGTPAGSVPVEGFDTDCRRFDYPWGYVIMNLSKKNWVLTEISIDQAGTFTGPRGTQIGDTESFVVDKFRDMQQVESKSGNRGLYALDNGSTGKIWVQEEGQKIIRYRYPVDSHWVQLEYLLSASGTVKNINLKYIP